MLDIAAEALTKDFGRIRAVDDVSFEVRPGRVVGLLGPNGSGKTTTLRMLLGLVTPTAGRAMIGGRPFAALDGPAHQVGVVLEAGAFHAGRTARNHLRVLAIEAGIARRRVGEVLELVGLREAADRRAGTFSLGMGGTGTALLLLSADRPSAIVAGILLGYLGASRMLATLRSELDVTSRARPR